MSVASAWSLATSDHPTALGFDATGQILAVADAAGEVLLADGAQGTLLARHRADPLGLLCLAWHPRLRLLAVGGQSGMVRVYGEAGLQFEVQLAGRWIEHLAWEPSGAGLAVVQSRVLLLLDLEGGRRTASEPQPSSLAGVAFRSSGQQVVTCCYGGVAVHDSRDLTVRRRFKWKGAMLGLALSPCGRIVACGGQDCTVHFWRFADGRDAQMSGYPGKPRSLSWRPDSRWLATSGARDVILWPFDGRGPEGRAPLALRAHEELVRIVAFAPDGSVLASTCDAGMLALWSTDGRSEPTGRRALAAPAAALAWGRGDSGQRLAVADASGVVQCWSA